MPGYPHPSPLAETIPGSVFSSLAHRLESFEGEVYPFHVGDTWMEPLSGARMEDLHVDSCPGMHRYAPPGGLPALVDALVERIRARTGGKTERENVMVTAGATAGLAAVMAAILEPGDEVLLLAPYWPLIDGIVRCFRGRPVAVPILSGVRNAEDLVESVRLRRTERSVALYLNSPNNPTGRVLPPAWTEALVAWAQRQGLWIIADEIYEDYVYDGEHRYASSLAPEHTFSAFSFSKAFGMAGNRCGYVVGPAPILQELQKIGTHTFYSTPTASQLAALQVLGVEGDAWVAAARAKYAELGRFAAARLAVAAPQGGTFLFLDVSDELSDRGLLGFLEDCAERGLFLAPGPSFGPFPNHVRLCFTATTPEITKRGVAVLKELLDQKRSPG